MINKGIQFKLDPRQWKKHLFGVPAESWARLNGKTFWVTGAGTGYGRSIAVSLAAAGGRVFLTGRRESKLQETMDVMSQFDIPTDYCHKIAIDITDTDQVDYACKKVSSFSDSLDGLVNNAALPSRGDIKFPLLEGTVSDWEKIIKTNLTAPWLLTRTIFPHMAKGATPRALFMSSEAGWNFTQGYGPYNISKAGLNNLCVSLASECAAKYSELDVQMNVLVPGQACTEMNQGSRNSPYIIVRIALVLLSHPKGGPNGKFFYWDGRYVPFCNAEPHTSSLV